MGTGCPAWAKALPAALLQVGVYCLSPGSTTRSARDGTVTSTQLERPANVCDMDEL